MKTKLNQSKLKLAIVSAIVAGSMGLSATSHASTKTSSMVVSTTVQMACSMTAGALTFLSYNPTSTDDNTAQGTITSTCTSGGAAKITIGLGGGGHSDSSDSSPIRQMKSKSGSAEVLEYDLYSDSGRSTEWGNTADTGLAITGTGSSVITHVYGTIPKSQTVTAFKNFEDTISVTLTY